MYITTSKTKYTNNARQAEIIGAFGLVTIYKNLRSFGSPKRHLYKIRRQRYYIFLIYANLILQFYDFSSKFYLFRQKCPTFPKIIARKSKPAGYNFPAEVYDTTESEGHEEQRKNGIICPRTSEFVSMALTQFVPFRMARIACGA